MKKLYCGPRAWTRVALLLLCVGEVGVSAAERAAKWDRWEKSFSSDAARTEEFTVEFKGPGGKSRKVPGFWDGGTTWKVRFMPDGAGQWQYSTSFGDKGGFECVESDSDNPFIKHGPVRVAENGFHFEHADGTPFFWLADTAWNGALLSTDQDWEQYLRHRKGQNFTAIQYVTTQWRTTYENAEGKVAYTGFDNIEIQPDFFKRIDERTAEVNNAGLLAVPVVLWSLGEPSYTPGKLPVQEAIKLARYIVARYHADHVVWFLPGDGNYSGENIQRWKEIGRAVFPREGHAPVTLHAQGMQWPFEPFRGERWVSFLGYQSGHGDDAKTLKWIHSGPPAQNWNKEPVKPVINLEPPYEAHIAYQSRKPHSDYTVRRATYWSLLNAPTAGTSYGAHGVWSWETSERVPLNHNNSGVAKPWNVAMRYDGSEQLKHMAELFTSVDWWELRPHQELVKQSAEVDPANFIAAARSANKDLAVIYFPAGGEAEIKTGELQSNLKAEWFNPRNGKMSSASITGNRVKTPDEKDWVLVFREP